MTNGNRGAANRTAQRALLPRVPALSAPLPITDWIGQFGPMLIAGDVRATFGRPFYVSAIDPPMDIGPARHDRMSDDHGATSCPNATGSVHSARADNSAAILQPERTRNSKTRSRLPFSMDEGIFKRVAEKIFSTVTESIPTRPSYRRSLGVLTEFRLTLCVKCANPLLRFVGLIIKLERLHAESANACY